MSATLNDSAYQNLIATRRQYKDCSIAEAIHVGCDIVQLKYDGWYTRIEINAGWMRFFSRTNRMFKEVPFEDHSLSCVLLGEHMQGTQWSQEPGRLGHTYIFDAWYWQGTDLMKMDFRSRYRVARMAVTQYLPSTFALIALHPIGVAEMMWKESVEPGTFEGLVFSKSTDNAYAPIYRKKLVITEDLRCTGFVEGMGKFSGTLGSLIGETLTDSPIRIDVGGGFDDTERAEIWANQQLYLGKMFEVEARARFESGSLRHPNFVKWRTDK